MVVRLAGHGGQAGRAEQTLLGAQGPRDRPWGARVVASPLGQRSSSAVPTLTLGLGVSSRWLLWCVQAEINKFRKGRGPARDGLCGQSAVPALPGRPLLCALRAPYELPQSPHKH